MTINNTWASSSARGLGPPTSCCMQTIPASLPMAPPQLRGKVAPVNGKGAKCHSLQASYGNIYDSSLVLQGDYISCIGHQFHWSIHSNPPRIPTKLSTSSSRSSPHSWIKWMLSQSLETRSCFKAAICPRTLWELGVSDLQVTP